MTSKYSLLGIGNVFTLSFIDFTALSGGNLFIYGQQLSNVKGVEVFSGSSKILVLLLIFLTIVFWYLRENNTLLTGIRIRLYAGAAKKEFVRELTVVAGLSFLIALIILSAILYAYSRVLYTSPLVTVFFGNGTGILTWMWEIFKNVQ